jgi:pimeloyl-ACP methyl ester carboxylesterase/class 3 adenylate cyclase
MQPETRYARTVDGVNIAYQVFGEVERDLVLVPGWIFNIEVAWEHPSFENFMRRLMRNFRVILFDKRGSGLSDRSVGSATVEERTDDVRAVMDAADSQHAFLLGWSEGGNIAAYFAATNPDRTDGLILYAAGARYKRAPDYPMGVSENFLEAAKELLRTQWGQGLGAYIAVPSRADDEAFRRWFGRYERLSVSPGEGLVTLEVNLDMNTTDMLRLVRTPTLVMHNVGDVLVPVDFARYIADLIPGAKLVELPGNDHLFWFSNTDDVVGEMEDFMLGVRSEGEAERVLSTVLFTDIVGSTATATRMGDARWKELLDIHDRIARESVHRFRGDLIKNMGDGLLATFDGPARAVKCAIRLRDALADRGLQLRAGLHTGELDIREKDVGGVAVHIGARIAAKADAGEVLTSRTVKDLSVGANIEFSDRGVHELQGLPEPWRLFAAAV